MSGLRPDRSRADPPAASPAGILTVGGRRFESVRGLCKSPGGWAFVFFFKNNLQIHSGCSGMEHFMEVREIEVFGSLG